MDVPDAPAQATASVGKIEAASAAWLEFDVSVAQWVLRLLELEVLPEAALGAVSAGCPGDSLLKLAILDGATWSEIGPFVKPVYDERGLVLPNRPQAVKLVADDLLRRLIAGAVDVQAGTRRLYMLTYDSRAEDLKVEGKSP